MLRSMYSGISGLRNFQTKLDVIGNNIANVSTAGFKKSRITFKDAMSQTQAGASASIETRGGKNGMQVGLGSSIASIDTIHTGSNIQSTNRNEDIAIQGDGYFVVKSGDAQYYTRAGALYLDNNGTLVNSDGYKIQAYSVDASGEMSQDFGDVTINVNALLPATSTSKVTLNGNLDNATKVGDVFTQQLVVVNANGEQETIEVHYKKTAVGGTAPNQTHDWQVFFNQDLSKVKENPTTATADATIQFAADGTVKFTGTGVTTNNTVSFDPDHEADPAKSRFNNVTLAIGDLTGNSGTGTSVVAKADGYTAGRLESFSIGASGAISGVYSNGQIATIGRLVIAKFSNSSGLNKAGGNLFQETINSGPANYAAAGEAGYGTIASSYLEMSNVDLSEEFTEMITAQRGFQANSRIITTSDEILQELVNLKR